MIDVKVTPAIAHGWCSGSTLQVLLTFVLLVKVTKHTQFALNQAEDIKTSTVATTGQRGTDDWM